jgi:hypothetical protein
MLYEKNNYYLKYAKESIINSNEKLSLDYLLYGFNLDNNIDKFTNIIKDFVSDKQKMSLLVIFIFIILIVLNI